MRIFSLPIDHSGFGKAVRTCVCFATLAFAAGCQTFGGSEPAETYLGSAPIVTGNTFDRYNELAVVPPYSENLSISYQFELLSDPRGDTVSGVPGPVWFYSERSAATPSAFIQIALLPGGAELGSRDEAADEEVPNPLAETVRLGRLDYVSRMHCVRVSPDGTMGPEVAALFRNVGVRGFGLSDDVFVRSFETEKAGLDGRRVAIVFARDVTRLGYDCDGLGDLFLPNADAEEAVAALREEASRSFEVVQ